MPTMDDYARALRGEGNYVAGENAGPSSWPNQGDVAFAQKNDFLYGNRAAPNATPGAANVYTAPLGGVSDWQKAWNQGNGPRVPEGTAPNLNTQQDASNSMAQGLAAERSAVAKLGWDPGLMVSTPPRNNGAVLNTAGTYVPDPRSGIMWHDQTQPSAAMHESMHRGLNLLRQQGHNIDRNQEEAYVRALMQRGFGDVEMNQGLKPGLMWNKNEPAYKQIQQGRELAHDPRIDELEALAAQEVARRHPGGPR